MKILNKLICIIYKGRMKCTSHKVPKEAHCVKHYFFPSISSSGYGRLPVAFTSGRCTVFAESTKAAQRPVACQVDLAALGEFRPDPLGSRRFVLHHGVQTSPTSFFVTRTLAFHLIQSKIFSTRRMISANRYAK